MGLSFVGPLDIEGLKLEVFVVKPLGRGLCVAVSYTHLTLPTICSV